MLALLLGPVAVPAHADPLIEPTITMAADQTTLDPGHPAATVTGLVTEPDGSGTKPVAGLEVDLQTVAGKAGQVVTDDTGHYTATFAPAKANGTAFMLWTSTPETGVYSTATSTAVQITVNQAPTRVTLTAVHTTVDEGTASQVTGTVEWQSESGWQAAHGASVSVIAAGRACQGSGPTPTAQIVKTDDAGNFAASQQLLCTGSFYAVVDDPLYQQSQATADVTVRAKLRFTNSATIDAFGVVTVTGWVFVANYYDRTLTEGLPVDVQYSNGNGKWQTVKRVKVVDEGYSLQVGWGASGYWRGVVPATTKVLGGTSSAGKAWRWNARLEGVKFSPTKVKKNHYITVTGKLTRAVSMTKRTGYAGRHVEIAFRFKGKKTWYHLAWATTDKYGRFKVHVKAHGSGYYQVIFWGGPDTFADWTNGKAYVRTYAAPADAAITPTRPTPPPPVVATEP